MPVDTQPDFKPPAPEKAKVTKEAKRPEFLVTVKQKVEGILDRWKGDNHSQIIHDLSSIKISEDQKSPINQSPEVTLKNTHQFSETTLSVPQQEISLLTQQIQQLQTESSPVPESAPKKLFPDRSSLYDQHHQEYDKEKRTIKGKITRLRDITELKKAGVKNVFHIYDGLRSRGISRDQIMNPNDDGKPRITRVEAKYLGEKTYDKIKNLKQIDLPKAIDRLYSIGHYDSQSFDSDTGFSDLYIDSQHIFNLSDAQFSQRRNDLQPYLFLKNTNIENLFTNDKFGLKPFLDYVNENYFSSLDPEQQTSVIKKQYIFHHQTYFNDQDSESASNIIQEIIKSDIKPGEKISVPSELISSISADSDFTLNCLNNLNIREHQQYFIAANYWEKDNFDSQTFLPKPSFYDSMVTDVGSYRYHLDREINLVKVDIPENVINTIGSPYYREFYTNLSQLPNIYLQKYYLSIKKEGKFDLLQYFQEGKPNFLFYRSFLNYCVKTYEDISPQEAFDTSKSQPILDNLDLKQQQAIKLSLKIIAIPNQDKSLKEKLLQYTLDPDSVPSFFNADGLPTTQLFDSLFKCSYGFGSYKSYIPEQMVCLLKDTLSLEVANQLTGDKAELWQYRYNLLQLKNIELFPDMLLDSPTASNINSFFTPDHLPTSLFFERYVNYDLFKSNISPELLLTFSPEDQKFWLGIFSLKDIDSTTTALGSILGSKNKETAGIYFNDKNQPTSFLFEVLAKKGFSQDKLFTSNFTPDVMNSFSPEDQKFWKIVLSFKRTDVCLSTFVVNNHQQIDSFFDSESKPTLLFFKNIISKTSFQDLSDSGFIRSNLTPELISTFSPEDQKLWNGVLGLKEIDSSILKIIGDKYSQIDLYFNQDNQPTSFFFESLIKDTNSQLSVSETGFLKSNLTPELLVTFSPEDQRFWSGIFSLKSIDPISLNSIIGGKNKDTTRLYFNDKNQPTDFFFRNIVKLSSENSKVDRLLIIKSNLTPELINTYSSEDQRFWKFVYDKNFSLENKNKIISDSLVSFILGNRDILASDSNDFDFLNSLVGNFGKKSESIINSYCQCIESKVITKEDRPSILEFLKEFKVLTPKIITGYKEAKHNQTEKLFISNLKEIARKLISPEQLSDADSQSPYYSDLIKHVYSNNSGNFASYESNDSCPDLSSQLSQFNIKDIYQIDLLSQSEIKLKTDQKPDPVIQKELESPVSRILENLKSINFDQEKGNQYLNQKLDTLLSAVDLPQTIDLIKLSLEEKLFLVVSEHTYNHQNINPDDIKNLLITYEFVNFEDIRNFIQGTNDKVSQAANPDYAHLCELSNFYSDRIKEVNKRIIESAASSQHINYLLPYYFEKLVKQSSEQTSQDSLNKFQVDKLGLTNSFLGQITKALKRRFPDRQFSSDQVRRMLHLYETVTQGLIEPKSTSSNKDTQALYGQVRSQREKTFGLLKQLGSEAIDPASIHLDEIDLKQALSVKKSIETNNYLQDEFLAYTSQKFIDIFSDERSRLESELSKYESETGSQREVLNAFITKTKSSANARMVGGVCVSGDNPTSPSGKQSEENMWNMPNYFQMVLQDPENYQCLGLCLMHHFQEGDKKVLTVSFNPSSTYVYSVDEASLFSGILNTIQEFASVNNFDYVTVSKNKMIRTNRTGGVFEQAIDKKISQINQTFSFSKEEQFSYSPSYKIKDMDIVWKRPSSP